MRKTKFERGGVYHLFNRGNHKKKIFFSERDNIHFLSRLYEIADQTHISIYVHCLMPNHYHLTARQLSTVSISILMHRFGISYTMYMNKKYHLVGHLFQGKFQAKRILNVLQLRRLIQYIKQNPVEAGLVKRPEDYRWLYISDSVWNAFKPLPKKKTS
jgi:REP element-mobilizing transposase RayT